MAERVADELGTELGDVVGYTVRFTDSVSDRTLVEVMTDGILLAEFQRDRTLSRYDTIIVDEAHERSLNIDFILGYLRQLLPRRPDLKVIVTSATIDTERFSPHFGGAPIIEVSGRTYPVEVRYDPIVDEDDDSGRDQIDGHRATPSSSSPTRRLGDVLVFLSGEREIRDTAQALDDLQLRTPKSSRSTPGCRRPSSTASSPPTAAGGSCLPTNVAETSLTVPGIRYVVDAGTARISRYNRRTKVQRLPDRGRCPRPPPTNGPAAAAGLHRASASASTPRTTSSSRPEYTEPEILRTNLASVILRMAALGLGDVAAFPFVDPPDSRAINDGLALLEELERSTPTKPTTRKRLTPLGRSLSEIPLDPRLGRMVVEAERQWLRARGHGHRRRPVHPGPPGAAGRQAPAGRRAPPPLRHHRLRPPRLRRAVGPPPPGRQQDRSSNAVPQAVSHRVPQLPPGAGVAGHLQPGPTDRRRTRDPCRIDAGRPPTPCTWPSSPAC